MSRPNFIVAGAAKSGTTTLDGYLKQHPDVYLPKQKESRYFSRIGDKVINPYTGKAHISTINVPEVYYSQYVNVSASVIGDVSPDYLYYHKPAITNILKELGRETRILIMLRNPIDRAYSNYLHILREGFHQDSFEEIIAKQEHWEAEQASIWYGFHILAPGFYAEAVKNYLLNFDHVKVVIFEDFIKDPEKVLKDICSFLNIDRDFKFTKPLFTNKTGVTKYPLLSRLNKSQSKSKALLKTILLKLLGKERLIAFVSWLKESNLTKPPMNPSTKEYLIKTYEQDISELEQIIDRDLSSWISK